MCASVNVRALYARPEHVGWLQVMGGDLKYPSGHFVMESPKMVNRQQPLSAMWSLAQMQYYIHCFGVAFLIEKISNMIIAPTVLTHYLDVCFLIKGTTVAVKMWARERTDCGPRFVW